MDLYTVRLNRQRVITVFGPKGAISTKTELVRETYADLPHKTALAYRTKFPEAQVEIERQAPSAVPARGRSHVAFGEKRTPAPVRPREETRPVPAEPAGPALRRTDYGTLVNTMLEG